MYNETLVKLIITALAWAILSTAAGAQMTYFGDTIDYWGRAESGRTGAHEEPAPEKAVKEFDWAPYLNPKNDEFFREGDYLPPAPFMEVARNPSDENLRRWFAYIQAKNATQSRLELRMQAFLHEKADKNATAPPLAPPQTESKAPFDTRRFALLFYFESSCPHCQRMAPEIGKLVGLGFQVEARQVDEAPLARLFPASVSLTRAGEEERQRRGIESVPLLLIADLKSKAVYRISGYQNAANIVRLIREKS